MTDHKRGKTGADPCTTEARLCDDDGWVRRGPMHHGEHYTCTGHAHFGGEHIRCTSPAHAAGKVPLPTSAPTSGVFWPRRPAFECGTRRPVPDPEAR